MTAETANLECPNCGASVDLPAEQVSSQCAFCETPLVRAAHAEDREPIDSVAPFTLTREQASGRLQRRLQGEWLAPEAVRRASRPEELAAVLVPFWCYNAVARSEYRGQVGIWWYETRVRTVMVNGKPQVRTERVRHTEWHPLSGTHVHTYIDHLVSASKGLPEAEANELEPFDLGRAKPFSPALLAGMTAERPTVDHDTARQTATAELAQRENRLIKSFLPGDEVRDVTNHTTSEVQKVRLLLLPVWIATYKHKGSVFRMLVNGQTGEVVGKVPRSWWKIGAMAGCFLAILALVLFSGALLALLQGVTR